MIDHENRRLRLIDWGLAEFYHPGQVSKQITHIFADAMPLQGGHCGWGNYQKKIVYK